jgi:hypothetical protein
MQPFGSEFHLHITSPKILTMILLFTAMEYVTEKKAPVFAAQQKPDFKPLHLLLKKKLQMIKVVVILYFRNII